jgi:hypothetical protein
VLTLNAEVTDDPDVVLDELSTVLLEEAAGVPELTLAVLKTKVMASSLTRATTRRPWADARDGSSVTTMVRMMRRNSADIAPAT